MSTGNWEVDSRGVPVDTDLAEAKCFTSAFSIGVTEVPVVPDPTDDAPSSYDDDDLPFVGGCSGTQYGCCENDSIAKDDSAGSNCDCRRNNFGCCADEIIAKSDEDGSNCQEVVSLEAADTVAGSSVTVLIAIAVCGLVMGLAMYVYVRGRNQSGGSMITNTANEYAEGPYPQSHQQTSQQYPSTVAQTQL